MDKLRFLGVSLAALGNLIGANMMGGGSEGQSRMHSVRYSCYDINQLNYREELPELTMSQLPSKAYLYSFGILSRV